MTTDIWVFDSECYTNYYLAMFKNIRTGEKRGWELFNDMQYGEAKIPDGQIITFNGINYDMPILSLMLAGANNAQLKATSDAIILQGLKYWQIDTPPIESDHIDLMEVAPGKASLKIYGGRLHSKKLQDLPIEPSKIITEDDRAQLIPYCENDLDTTADLYNYLKPQLELREAMSAEFGVDLRSKSDAQIAEAVIKREVEKHTGQRLYRPEIHPSYTFKYKRPSWVQFSSPGLQHALGLIEQAEFKLDHNGNVGMPAIFDILNIRIGQAAYTLGIGGLHSTESSVSHFTDANMRLTDVDATSFYPSLILNEKWFPTHIGELFLKIYADLKKRRVDAKKAGDTIINEVLKIVINGSFGKMGSKWSVLYAPDLMIQVTLTGQLALLMLIEMFENQGMLVTSGNTDGITVKYSEAQNALFHHTCCTWERITGLELEYTEYVSTHNRDVNNYITIKPDGSAKQKGVYSFVGSKKSELEKNPMHQICIDAVINYLANGVPLDMTIKECRDIRRFICVRKVEGGGEYKGEFLGKAVRWYYAIDNTEPLKYAKNGHKVPMTDGAIPMMQLSDHMPNNIDYGWYIKKSQDILKEIGL